MKDLKRMKFLTTFCYIDKNKFKLLHFRKRREIIMYRKTTYKNNSAIILHRIGVIKHTNILNLKTKQLKNNTNYRKSCEFTSKQRTFYK